MTEWILFICLLDPVSQAVQCGSITTPTEEICIARRAEIEALAGIIATAPCRSYLRESGDDS